VASVVRSPEIDDTTLSIGEGDDSIDDSVAENE